MDWYKFWCSTDESTAWMVNACNASWLITLGVLNVGIGLLVGSSISSNIGDSAGLGDSSDSSCVFSD